MLTTYYRVPHVDGLAVRFPRQEHFGGAVPGGPGSIRMLANGVVVCDSVAADGGCEKVKSAQVVGRASWQYNV